MAADKSADRFTNGLRFTEPLHLFHTSVLSRRDNIPAVDPPRTFYFTATPVKPTKARSIIFHSDRRKIDQPFFVSTRGKRRCIAGERHEETALGQLGGRSPGDPQVFLWEGRGQSRGVRPRVRSEKGFSVSDLSTGNKREQYLLLPHFHSVLFHNSCFD